MRAIEVARAGAAPEMVERPDPGAPGPGEVRLRIAACGLNFADLLMIEGSYQERPALPFVPGMELAGRIEATGPGVTGLAPGDRVAVHAGHGGLAEVGIFAAARCHKLPEGVGMVTAAGLPIAYGTAHLALARRARLAEAETLLVLGAAGGVGLAAVEVGRALGARVIAVARGTDRLAAAGRAGAAELIDSDTPDLRGAVLGLGGADVCFDPVGGEAGEAALRALRPEGRYIPIGFASGRVPELAANRLLVKNLTVIGLYFSGYAGFAPGVLDASLKTLFGWAAAGRIDPQVSHVLPLERAIEGLELLRMRKATGKIVIRLAGEADQAA